MVLLFAIGDTYQLVDRDALLAARLLGLDLSRSGPNLCAGFAARALEIHLRRLLNAGQRVAICELAAAPNS